MAGNENDAGTTGNDGTAGASGAVGEEPVRPLLRVVKGDPTPEELAALVTVLAARAAGTVEAPQPIPSAWSHRRAQLSKPVFVGYGEWRRSGFEKGTRTKADW